MTIINDPAICDHDISDAELAALALDANPDVELGDDARPLRDLDGFAPEAHLPNWYMPTPMARRHVVRGWRRRAIWLVIAAFVTIDTYGLCNTYGDLHVAPTHLQR